MIESEKYRVEEDRLKADPIVKALAGDVPRAKRADLVDKDGSPSWEFMQSANAEYHKRGGAASESLGGIGRAIVALWREEGR